MSIRRGNFEYIMAQKDHKRLHQMCDFQWLTPLSSCVRSILQILVAKMLALIICKMQKLIINLTHFMVYIGTVGSAKLLVYSLERRQSILTLRVIKPTPG